MTAQPSSVGRYVMCGEIASGGMATIFIGHPTGSTRPVAIKRLLKPYASNPEFVTMFLDEVWLAARIHHPNIVETLDVVSADGELVLVMEYIAGETLSRVLRTCRDTGTPMPLPIVASIICGVLQGLHAVHEAKDEKGNALEIVHRDVTPQNVIVATDGVPRIIDFGVAKAAVRLQTTRAGQIKGKLAYMAPEQLDYANANRLTDLYSVGVLLWEALANKRLFEAETEGQLVGKVANGVSRGPSSVRPDVPKELDAITMCALAKDPSKRFANARQMAHALELATPIARASQVAEWLQTVASASLEERARRVADLLSGDAARQPEAVVPPAAASRSSLSNPGSAPSSPSMTSGLSRPSSASHVRAIDSTPSSAATVPPPRASKRPTKNVLVIDDSDVILDKVKRTLEGDGYVVTTTSQSVGAARHLKDCDLAIIDFHMPGIDGGTVIQSLRAAANANDKTCLFYLYTADASVAKDFARMGFDGAFTDKGDDAALVRQVRGAFRVLQMRAMKK